MSGRILDSCIALLLVVMLVVGCRGEPEAATPDPATDTSTASAETIPTASANATTPAPRRTAPAATDGAAAEITIGTPATNETLYLPDTAKVGTGEMVRMIFVNSTNTPHNLTFNEPINAATDSYIEAGQSDAFTFTAPRPGDYEFYCTLHPWMTGTLSVTP